MICDFSYGCGFMVGICFSISVSKTSCLGQCLVLAFKKYVKATVQTIDSSKLYSELHQFYLC